MLQLFVIKFTYQISRTCPSTIYALGLNTGSLVLMNIDMPITVYLDKEKKIQLVKSPLDSIF